MLGAADQGKKMRRQSSHRNAHGVGTVKGQKKDEINKIK
jgi:hypothetical protein